MPNRLEIAPKTLLWVGAIAISGWLLYLIRDILALLFVSYILMTALKPLVEWIVKMRLPRFLAILITYILIVSIFVGFGRMILPPLVNETGHFFNALPNFVNQLAPYASIDINTLIQQVAPIGQNVLRLTLGVFANIITIFTVAVFTFYFLLEHNHLENTLNTFIGEEWSKRTIRVLAKIEERLGAWVRGQMLLALIIGVFSYIGLLLLGINYALPLALIAGILEVVPIIGPIISGVPAVLVALTISPGLALGVVGLYFLIQQVENNILVPAVMRKAVGVAPLASLLALMVGGRLGGILGIILSVPILLVVQTLFAELLYKNTPKEI